MTHAELKYCVSLLFALMTEVNVNDEAFAIDFRTTHAQEKPSKDSSFQ